MTIDESTGALIADWELWNAALQKATREYAVMHPGGHYANEAMADMREIMQFITERMEEAKAAVDAASRSSGYQAAHASAGSEALRLWLQTSFGAPR